MLSIKRLNSVHSWFQPTCVQCQKFNRAAGLSV
uniref:Uncharacterized protein n=1 Tax=Anguilla anguilla TaxID=7936 RepID=A0A0E9THX2_ANGAN